MSVTSDVPYYEFVFFQAEDGIRDLVRSRGLGDVYKRQVVRYETPFALLQFEHAADRELAFP